MSLVETRRPRCRSWPNWPTKGRRSSSPSGRAGSPSPLAARGLRVDGIELSAAMVAKLRAKLADVLPDGIYHMVFVVFNSLFNLLSQDEQVRCFDNVAGHRGRGVRAQLPAPTA